VVAEAAAAFLDTYAAQLRAWGNNDVRIPAEAEHREASKMLTAAVASWKK
jgi:hypothetical protein